jgi:hypothetical protein
MRRKKRRQKVAMKERIAIQNAAIEKENAELEALEKLEIEEEK